MTKICHFTSVHPIDDIRIFHKECVSLATNGYDVTLIACGEKSFEDVVEGVKRISLSVPVKNRLQRFFKRSKAVYKKAIEVNADIYHFHDPELLPIGYLLQRKSKIVFFDAHEDFPKQILQKTYIPKILRSIVSKGAFILDKYFSKKLDLILTTVPSITNKYNNFGCTCVEVCNYPIMRNTVLPTWETRKHAICYAGGITKIRGIENLLESVIKTEYVLNLAGPFSNASYENKLRSHPGWKQVNYFGYVTQEALLTIYKESKIGMGLFHPAPNHNEGISTKLYEYMYAGLPVIVSDCVKSNREIVLDNKCGIVVNPFNIKEIVIAIEKLMNDDTLAQEMGNNGRKAIEELYNWNNEEKKLLNAYVKYLK